MTDDKQDVTNRRASRACVNALGSAVLPRWARVGMQAAGAIFLFAAPALHALGFARDSSVHIMAGGVALLLFGVLDRLERFSAWGLSATLREAEKAAEEAKASAAEVRTLTLSVLRLSLSLAHAGGRMDGNQRARGIVDAEAVRLLNELDASATERREVLAAVAAIRLHDLAGNVQRSVAEAVAIERRSVIDEEILRRGDAWSRGDAAPSSAQLRVWARSHNTLTPQVEVALSRLAAEEGKLERGESADMSST